MKKAIKYLIVLGFCFLSYSNLVYASIPKATSSDAEDLESDDNQNKENAKKYFDILNQYNWELGKDTNLSIAHTDACPPEKAIDYLYDYFPEPYEGIKLEIEYLPGLEEFGGIVYKEPEIYHVYDKKGNFIQTFYWDGYGGVKYEISDEDTGELYYFGGFLFDIKPVAGFTEEVRGILTEQESDKKSSKSKESHKKYLNPSIYGGTWVRDGGSWKLRNSGSYAKSQWAYVNEKWYLFDVNGYMLTGWQEANGKWYLLDTDGAMLTGWQKTGDEWYYLAENGDMLFNTVTPDGYKVDSNGKWIK